MIVTENVIIDGRQFTHNYSDENRYVVRDGISYAEAYDPAEFGRTYTEGDVMPTDETLEDKAEAYDILMGVEE